jgi:hypothetical protein
MTQPSFENGKECFTVRVTGNLFTHNPQTRQRLDIPPLLASGKAGDFSTGPFVSVIFKVGKIYCGVQ